MATREVRQILALRLFEACEINEKNRQLWKNELRQKIY